ncbi:MAG: ABC transporter permease [Solirubrobacteraceae bacterium]
MILILIRLFRRWRDRRPGSSSFHGATTPRSGNRSLTPRDAGGSAVPQATRADAPRAQRRSAAARGSLALLVHQVRYDLLASVRNPRARFFTFLYPVLLLVVFTSVFGHGSTVVEGVRIPVSHYFLAGILAMSIITATYSSLIVSVATARETGVLKRRRATPASPTLLIAGQALTTLLIALVMSIVLLTLGRIAYGISLPAAALVAIAPTVVTGTIAFAGLGYAAAGMIGSLDAAQPIAQATMMPLYFISGVWIPTTQLPHALNSIAQIFPVEHLAAALHQASVNTSISTAISPQDLAILALWALAAAAFAIRRFSWLPEHDHGSPSARRGNSSAHLTHRSTCPAAAPSSAGMEPNIDLEPNRRPAREPSLNRTLYLHRAASWLPGFTRKPSVPQDPSARNPGDGASAATRSDCCSRHESGRLLAVPLFPQGTICRSREAADGHNCNPRNGEVSIEHERHQTPALKPPMPAALDGSTAWTTGQVSGRRCSATSFSPQLQDHAPGLAAQRPRRRPRATRPRIPTGPRVEVGIGQGDRRGPLV